MTSRVSDVFPLAGLAASRPADPGIVPAFYSATDTGVVWRWNGATWDVWALALPEGGTTGYVPKWDAGAGTWVSAAETGGGGGSAPVTPDTPPVSPHADDYEFTGTSTSLPSGWSYFNGGTTTYNEAAGVGAIAFQAGGSDEWRGVVRAVPAGTSWTTSLKFGALVKQGASTYPAKALALRDSATAKVVTLQILSMSSDDAAKERVAWAIDYYSSSTAYGSRLAGGSQIGLGGGINYFRVKKNSATSWDFYVSNDGAAWLPLATALNISTSLTPNQVGVAVNGRANPIVGSAGWYRVT